jgi:hypothetical protein
VFAYRPGSAAESGFAIVAERFVALVGERTPASVAAALFHLLEAPQTRLDDVLDVFTTHDQVTRLAVVEVVDAGTRTFRVAVHGAVAVELQGATSARLSGPASAAWFLSEVAGVRSLAVALDDAEGGSESLPLGRGVAAASALALVETETEPPSTPEPRPAETHAARTSPVALPSPQQLEADLAHRDPASPAQARATWVDLGSEGAPSGWFALLPDGTELEIRTPIVLGRRPWAAGVAETGSRVVHVPAPSPLRQISGLHLELSLVDGQVRARDLDSTNGTVVVSTGRPPRLVHGGETTAVASQDILDLGESFRVVVTRRD